MDIFEAVLGMHATTASLYSSLASAYILSKEIDLALYYL